MRLAEILGAMHHLQQLCKAHDDQTWRKQMIVLMKAEGARGVKHTRLVSSFNQGLPHGAGRPYQLLQAGQHEDQNLHG